MFDAFVRHSPDDRHAAVAETLGLRSTGLVVDVGGGDGGPLAALLVANPAMRGLFYDRPHVVAGAPAVLAAAGVAARCRVEAGDFFARVPAGGDVYVLSPILHDWDDGRAALILRRCVPPWPRVRASPWSSASCRSSGARSRRATRPISWPTCR
jgi:hypothetical protein